MRDQPWYLLTRHFFRALFDFGVLSDVAAESFKRVLLGASAVALGLGLLLVRIFMVKYANLAGGSTGDQYSRELFADHAFLIAVPMWVVAFATTLVSHTLFPDEMDYRILMAQPISRGVVFGAKLLALVLFAGLIVAAAHAALLPLFVVTTLNPWATGSVVVRFLTYAGTSFTGSLFAVLAVAALQGALLLLAPRGRLASVSVVVRSGLVWTLVLALPLVIRLPGAARAFDTNAPWLAAAPPAWFAGAERWLLRTGPPHAADLALVAVAAILVVLTVSVATYGWLYRRFDRVTVRPQSSSAARRRASLVLARRSRRPIRAAVRTFAMITLRRSVLHQGILVALAAIAAGMVLNAALAIDDRSAARSPTAMRDTLTWLVIWMPFVLMFIAAPAARLTLSVPIELRANWIFRMTEDEDARVDAIDAAVHTVFRLGVIVPVALSAACQWFVIGAQTLPVAAMTPLIGWLFVETIMRDWSRVPFTCSFMPGKGFVPPVFVGRVFGFLLFTSAGTLAAQLSLLVPGTALVFAAIFAVAAMMLRWRRRSHARSGALAFEDELPSEINPLRIYPN